MIDEYWTERIANKDDFTIINGVWYYFDDWLPEFYRILKNDSHCYIMTNNKNITHYLSTIDKSDFHYIKNLIWVKDNKMENICMKLCFGCN